MGARSWRHGYGFGGGVLLGTVDYSSHFNESVHLCVTTTRLRTPLAPAAALNPRHIAPATPELEKVPEQV
jgi:hypothetical protein